MPTLGSDNEFPKLYLTNDGDSATPAAGLGKLYVNASKVLHYIDDAGLDVPLGTSLVDPMTTRGDIIVRNASNVTARLGRGTASQVLTSDGTDLAWATPSSGFADPMTTRGDVMIRNAANATARLGRGTAGYVFASDGTDVAYIDPKAWLPWHLYIPCTASTPDATTGTWTLGSSSTQAIFPFYTPGSAANSGTASIFQNSTGTAVNDAAAWDCILGAGTWDAHFWVRKHSAAAIITLEQDGSSMGTVDTYDAGGIAAKLSITGWTVSTTGKKRMNLKAATKNGSSSNYIISLFAIELRRTA